MAGRGVGGRDGPWLSRDPPLDAHKSNQAGGRALEHHGPVGAGERSTMGGSGPSNPFEHIAVKDIVDEDVTIGHILMYPWYDKRADTKQTQIIVNNKIRIVRSSTMRPGSLPYRTLSSGAVSRRALSGLR